MTSAAGSETPAVDYRRKPGKGEPSGHPLSLWVKLENMRKTGGTRGCQITRKKLFSFWELRRTFSKLIRPSSFHNPGSAAEENIRFTQQSESTVFITEAMIPPTLFSIKTVRLKDRQAAGARVSYQYSRSKSILLGR